MESVPFTTREGTTSSQRRLWHQCRREVAGEQGVESCAPQQSVKTVLWVCVQPVECWHSCPTIFMWQRMTDRYGTW